MMLMIIVILVVLGLCFGSFVNALVWRFHEQTELRDKNLKHREKEKRGAKTKEALNAKFQSLSITTGRSMCPHCKHNLTSIDLIPVLSWLSLKARCRYCHQSISAQYPLVELGTALLFVSSYLWWPVTLSGSQVAVFGLWLVLLVGLLALFIYDIRWMLLPNRIIYPLAIVAVVQAIVSIVSAANPTKALVSTILAVVVGGGIFYVLFQVSDGKWIGGGDVRLGWLLGLIAGTGARSFLLIFVAAVLGSVISLPFLATQRLKRTSVIPFGPFLIIAMIVVQLFGHTILFWYQRTFLPFTV